MPTCLKSLALALILWLPATAAPMRPSRAPHAMVASEHEAASQAGVEILKAGGNAVDAAVATGFALAVVHPEAGNLGGGGFMLVRTAEGKESFLDFRETAPAKASVDMFVDRDGNVIPDASVIGYRSVAVPGSVAGLAKAEKTWGKLTLRQVMAPAIKLAREGFILSDEDAELMRDAQLARFSESRRLFQRDGKYYEAGERFRQPELARTLERIAEDPDSFYHGDLAREIAAAVQKGGGLITTQDLTSYEVKLRQPIHGVYRGYKIISAPPPSSGGVSMVEALNILESFDLRESGDRSAESIHLIAEAYRRAYFDRSEFLADPDFIKVPVAQLIDKRYGTAWRAELNPEKATPSQEVRRPDEFSKLETYACAAAGGCAAGREGSDTTHYSVVDADGNAVAVTTTLNDNFGSRITVEGLGFLLNDEMDDFTSKLGTPNLYGLVQGAANEIAPGKRPLSSMTPTIVLTPEDKLFLVLGSPGGSRIPTTVTDILIGVIDWGEDIQQAVNAPRFHHQWLPDVLVVESGISPDTIKLLRSMGHSVEQDSYWSDGECIAIDPRTGERLGASDGRHNGKALGY
jgi:gamma-glutamyltranspeptidase / glutathione hydrolase